jgi:hypothetical protein
MNRLRKLGSMKINSFKVIEFRYLSEGKKWEKKSLDNAISYNTILEENCLITWKFFCS